jgi:hypothetical protein
METKKAKRGKKGEMFCPFYPFRLFLSRDVNGSPTRLHTE